jgi:hypothetical protein
MKKYKTILRAENLLKTYPTYLSLTDRTTFSATLSDAPASPSKVSNCS